MSNDVDEYWRVIAGWPTDGVDSKKNFSKRIHLRVELDPKLVGATDWSISFKFNGSLPIVGPEEQKIHL